MLKLGPFTGGLNNFSDPTSIKDTELSVCKNFDYDVDGTLISRPPVVIDSSTGPVAGKNVDIIGYLITTTGTVYLIACSNNNIYQRSSDVWTLIQSGVKSSACVQYLNKIWIVADPDSANNGGSWDPVAGWTTVASMPKGSAITIFKERLWIAAGKLEPTNNTRLYFSAIGDGATWAGADFIDISKGDGQDLVDLYSLSTNLYLFKENSTHVLQYDSSPSKGVVNPVSKTIGVADIRCVVQYENILYVYHNGYLYELINYQFNKVNIRVDITKNSSGTYFKNVHLSLLGNRIVVFYYGNIFVFYLFTRTWSQWTTAIAQNRFWYIPNSAVGSIPGSYQSASNIVDDRNTYNFLDGLAASRSETINARFETKIYDFNSPNLYKKLYWWGVDLLSSNTVDAYAVPVIYNFGVTWDQMAAFTWDQVANNTWDRPADIDISIHENIPMPGANRKFLKVQKSCRFRNIYFILDFTITDWLNAVRIYSVTPVINVKEQVAKTTN